MTACERCQRAPLTLELAAAELARRTGLTRRQEKVLSMLARGMRKKTIAVELDIDHRTVSEHVARACFKIGVRDPEELVGRLIDVLLELANQGLGGSAPALSLMGS